jgi:LPPG:FO 2-phospho-L-lactate transferase
MDPGVAVLAGGVGAARFLTGLVQVVDPGSVTAVVNTADDTVLHGLHVSPDLDTVTYTLAGAIDPERGWGLAGESWQAMGALGRYTPHRPEGSSAGGTWFNLGDRDLATHLYRTGRLAEGAPLSAVAAEVAAAWGVAVRLLPMSDDPVRTVLTVPGEGDLGFQEYFVGRRHSVAVSGVRFDGVAAAAPAPGVLEALERAGAVVIAPSNPVVSIGPILAVPGVREVLAARRASVVAVSPIVGGRALKGPADRLLEELGSESSAAGVARAYAGVCGTLVVDEVDAALAPAVEEAGLACVVTPTVMSSRAVAAALARTVLAAA